MSPIKYRWVFVPGGRIGRLRYLINSAAIGVTTALGVCVAGWVNGVASKALPDALRVIVAVSLIVPIIVWAITLKIMTIRKRVRDIQGCEKANEF